jgi:hypothetical protein
MLNVMTGEHIVRMSRHRRSRFRRGLLGRTTGTVLALHKGMTHNMATTGASDRLSRRERLVYRTATGLVLAVMVFSIINFIFNDRFPFPSGPEGAFVHLGFPWYFKIELTVAKILGVLALVVPNIPCKVKEFAYAGFAITLASASIAHLGRGDAGLSVLFIIDPLIFLGLLIISSVYFEKSHSPAAARPGGR